MKTKTRKEHLQDIVEEWRGLGNEWPVPLGTVVRWALDTGRIQRSHQSVVDYWCRRFQEALREEMYTDPQGRRVRKKHSFPKVVTFPSGVKHQKYFWCDIETAVPDQMRASVQNRRRQMVADGTQLQVDVNSYNDNNKHGAVLQLNLNLTYDVEEALQDTDYRPPMLDDDPEDTPADDQDDD